jgi:hypothetical protein
VLRKSARVQFAIHFGEQDVEAIDVTEVQAGEPQDELSAVRLGELSHLGDVIAQPFGRQRAQLDLIAFARHEGVDEREPGLLTIRGRGERELEPTTTTPTLSARATRIH